MNASERLPRISADAVAASMNARTSSMLDSFTPLFAALRGRILENPELLGIASHGVGKLPEVHLFIAVHYLLLRDPRDPLAQYFGSLTESPAPPKEAFPEFARFCKRHCEEIVHLLETRTIQLTKVERCQALMPVLSHVADLAGEPLDLIEIGCSAGVLLTFDKYAYELKGRSLLGPKDAPLTLSFDMQGGPELHIAKIGKRIGLDLRLVNVELEDERLWLLAQIHPEWQEVRANLAAAVDVVAQTDINFFEGDALDLLPELIAERSGPLCIYHANCIVYWNDDTKARLDARLLEASRGREFYRVSMEPDFQRQAQSSQHSSAFVEIILSHYRDGVADSKVVAHSAGDNTTVTWLD